MYEYIPLSVSLHLVQNLGWIFFWHDACKSEMSIFQTHTGECFVCFMIMILMSPHPHPSKALQGDRQSWKKNTTYQPGKKVV